MPRKSPSEQQNSPTLDQILGVDKTIPEMSNVGEPQAIVSNHSDIDLASIVKLSDTIRDIRHWHRERCFAMEQRKRNDLALGAYLRTCLGWRKSLPDAERKTIEDQARDLLDNPEGCRWESVIRAQLEAREPFARVEKDARKEMIALAETLPVWTDFGLNVRGFGPTALAVIVAEAGDLSNYPSIAKLWKRMGLAVIDGKRQGNPGKNAAAEVWIEHGYNPKRRSAAWQNIGDPLIKGNKDGPYRTAYLARKEYELTLNPEMSKKHAHMRAQRYMEKRLLKHLWQAWRRTCKAVAEKPTTIVSDADQFKNAA